MNRQPAEEDKGLLRFYHRDHHLLGIHSNSLRIVALQTREWNELTARQFLLEISRLEHHLAEHHALEEDLLFPALTDQLGTASQPVAIITREHQQLVDLLGLLRQEATRCRQTGKATEEMRSLINQFYRLLHDHMHMEEKLLFPMAAQLLPSAKKIELIHAVAAKRETDKEGV